MRDHIVSKTDPITIEADLQDERRHLVEQVNRLVEHVSLAGITADAVKTARQVARPVLQSADRTIRDHPLPIAMMGAGLAWLAVSALKRRDQNESVPVDEIAVARWEDEGGNLPPDYMGDGLWISETDSARRRAIAALYRLDAAEVDLAIDAEDARAERSGILERLTQDASRALRHGLETMTSAAQDTVANAREAFYLAHDVSVSDIGRRQYRNPYIYGLIAASLGATVAQILPMTETEHQIMGHERDQLLRDVSRGALNEFDAFVRTYVI